MGVLKPYYRKKLLRICIKEWGYSEEECKRALETLETELEKHISKSIKQVIKQMKMVIGYVKENT